MKNRKLLPAGLPTSVGSPFPPFHQIVIYLQKSRKMISTLILITIIVIVTLKTIMLSLPHLPDDRLRGLLLPRPLSCEELVPDRSKCIDVACPIDEDYQMVIIVIMIMMVVRPQRSIETIASFDQWS